MFDLIVYNRKKEFCDFFFFEETNLFNKEINIYAYT